MEDQVKKLMMGLLAYAAQRDLSVENLCHLSNVTILELQSGHPPLSQKQVNDLWLNALHLSKDKLFGLHFGESLQLSALGVVGDIIKSSETVGKALLIAASLTHLITRDFILEVRQEEETFSIIFNPVMPEEQNATTGWESSPAIVQMLDLLMVFVIHELDGLILRKIKPLSVSYARQINDIAEYERVMRCKPVVDKETYITFEKKYWNEPIITANYEMQSILLQKVAGLKNPMEEKVLKNRIYNYLLENSYLGLVSLNDIASNFNISTRTLQRKLKEEGINFQQLADEARMALAINYLKAGSYPVKEISYMLGYNELSAFTRTFKRWTGITPALYQKNHN